MISAKPKAQWTASDWWDAFKASKKNAAIEITTKRMAPETTRLRVKVSMLVLGFGGVR